MKAAGLATARARPLPPAWPSLRVHKAPGADVRAPLGTAGPQCRRSCAALPPRPGAKSQAASPAQPQRSQPGARPRARARQTCKLVPPALVRPRGAQSPGARTPPASLQPWVSDRAGPMPPARPPPRPRPLVPASQRGAPRPTPSSGGAT